MLLQYYMYMSWLSPQTEMQCEVENERFQHNFNANIYSGDLGRAACLIVDHSYICVPLLYQVKRHLAATERYAIDTRYSF